MLQIIIFMLVLALAYVIKAGAVMLTSEELSENSTAFSWVRADAHEEGATPIWATDEAAEVEVSASPRATVRPMRRQVA